MTRKEYHEVKKANRLSYEAALQYASTIGTVNIDNEGNYSLSYFDGGFCGFGSQGRFIDSMTEIKMRSQLLKDIGEGLVFFKDIISISGNTHGVVFIEFTNIRYLHTHKSITFGKNGELILVN